MLLLGTTATVCKIKLFSQDSAEPFEISPEKLQKDGYKDQNNNLCMKINERDKTGRLFLFNRYKSYESPCNWKLNLKSLRGPPHEISKPEENELPNPIKKVCFILYPVIKYLNDPPCSGEACEQTTDNIYHEFISGTQLEKDVDKKKMEHDKTISTNTTPGKLQPVSDAAIISLRASNMTIKIQDSSDNSPGGAQNIQSYGILIIMAFVFILIT